MPFPARQVGCARQSAPREISTREVLAFAAGLGAAEALDESAPGGLVALPFFCVTLEWPLTLEIRAESAPDLTQAEARQAVHAAQDSVFHRPLRPGETVITDARLVAAKSVRAGALVVTRFCTRDMEGRPVATSFSTTIFRDVPLAGEGGEIETAPTAPPAPSLEPVRELAIETPRALPIVYGECSGIWNPIHSERDVALSAGLPDIIVHGTATWSLAGLFLSRAELKPCARLKRLSARFVKPVVPDQTLRLRYAGGRDGAFGFEVLREDGQPALANGCAVLG